MNGEIDTSKPLTIYQSKITLIGLLLFYFSFGLVFVYLPIANHNLSQKNLFIVIGAFLILLFFFIKTCRQFFIKTPLLQVDTEGFFIRKTGRVLWSDISDIKMLGATQASSIIVLVFKDGKKVNINPVNMRMPDESAFVVDRAFGVYEVMYAYRKASGSQEVESVQ